MRWRVQAAHSQIGTLLECFFSVSLTLVSYIMLSAFTEGVMTRLQGEMMLETEYMGVIFFMGGNSAKSEVMMKNIRLL